MSSHPSLLALAFACLACLPACNRPATEVTPASLQSKASRVEADASADDALITSQVQSALAEAEDINGKDIRVSTREGQVTLSGSIPARQIERAEEVARNVDGVREVDNQLKPVGVMA